MHRLEEILQLVIPPECALCGDLLDTEDGRTPLCDPCRRDLARDLCLCGEGGHHAPGAAVVCVRCGRPLTSEQVICLRCRDREWSFDLHRSLFRYVGIGRLLIRRYKFEGHRRLSGVLADLLLPLYRSLGDSLPICPVPARRGSRRRRGYDPVALVADRLPGPRLDLLERRGSSEQKRLGRTERVGNVRTAYGLARTVGNQAPQVPDEIILLDDVFTTGATADACAAILRSGGARKIIALTFALD